MTVSITIHGVGFDDQPADLASPRSSWTLRVTEIGKASTVGYTCMTWAEVDARIRGILAQHNVPADPSSRIEAMTLTQTRRLAKTPPPLG